jgi:DNA-binding transcriptional LysR family regulator
MHTLLEWSDLRLVLAVAQEGSLSGAARTLGVRHSTVFRRLGVIEQKLGVRLFERFRDGYSPTSAGDAAASVAARIAEDVLSLERRLSGQDLRPSGIVRITTTDTVGGLLTRHLSALRAAHPEIGLEIAISNVMANLTRREADIAIRPTPEPPETLVGRRIADIAHAIYGSPDYLNRSENKDLFAHEWFGLDDALVGTAIGTWLQRTCRRRALPTVSTRFPRCATSPSLDWALHCCRATWAISRSDCVAPCGKLCRSPVRRFGYSRIMTSSVPPASAQSWISSRVRWWRTALFSKEGRSELIVEHLRARQPLPVTDSCT